MMSRTKAVKFQQVTFCHEAVTTALFQGLNLHLDSGWTGVVGANGTGKTTLLKLATGLIVSPEGTIDRPPRAIYCPQRTDAPPERFDSFLYSVDKTAHVIKGQLGVREDWIGRWSTLSHGERKRAQIGVALWSAPDLLAVDEPTNHMDLPSIECLEQALLKCPCGLLLVSHDTRFLDKLTRKRWHISGEKGHGFRLEITG